MSVFKINVTELPEGQNNFEPIPAGVYTAQIAACEQKKTKDGTGSYLNFQYKILGPAKFANRVVFDIMNVVNKSEIAQKIGRESLRFLMVACGLDNVADTDEFIGQMLMIKVKIKPAKDGYEAGNSVSGYEKIDGGMPTQNMPSAPTNVSPWASVPKAPEPKTEPNKPAWAK